MASNETENGSAGRRPRWRWRRPPGSARMVHGELLGPGSRWPVMTPTWTPGEVTLGEAPAQIQISGCEAGTAGRCREDRRSATGPPTRWPTSRPWASDPTRPPRPPLHDPGRGAATSSGHRVVDVARVEIPRSRCVDPQMPDRIGRVTTQSGRTSRASSMSWSPKGIPAGIVSAVIGRWAGSRLAGGAPNSSAFTGPLPGCP